MTQIQTATTDNDHSIIESKPTPAEIIRQGVEAEPMTETIIPFLEETGLGGNKGKLTKGEKLIAYAVVARCKEEVVKVVQANNDKIIALFDAAADRQAKVTVGVAGAVGMGLGKVVSGIGGFLGGQFVPVGAPHGAGGSSVGTPPTASTLWTRFNKRGYFVFLTLVVTAIVAVGVTKATQSWESAAKAARETRDSLAETNTRLTSELDKTKEDKAKVDGELKNIKEQLDVAVANSAIYRDRYNELAGRTAVAPDVKDIQSKLDAATASLVTKSEELGRVQGQVQSSKEAADGYKKLYDRMLAERDTAKKEVRTIQAEKDALQDELATLKRRLR